MRRIISILLFLSAFPLWGQNIIRDKYGYYHCNRYGYCLTGGFYQANFRKLNERARQLGATTGFGNAYFTAGIEAMTMIGGRYGDDVLLFGVEGFVPERLRCGDTLELRLNGFHVMTSFLSRDLIHDEALDFIVAPGIDFGSAWYAEKNSLETVRWRNGFISPLLRVEFAYVWKRLIIGTRLTYRYDITGSKWQNNRTEQPDFSGTRFSGLGAQLFIGLHKLTPAEKPTSQFVPAGS